MTTTAPARRGFYVHRGGFVSDRPPARRAPIRPLIDDDWRIGAWLEFLRATPPANHRGAWSPPPRRRGNWYRWDDAPGC